MAMDMSDADQQMFAVELQKAEMRAMHTQYLNLNEMCTQKCLNTRFDSAKLYKGEAICLAKCTEKYLEFAYELQNKVSAQQEAQSKFYMEEQRQQMHYMANKTNWFQ